MNTYHLDYKIIAGESDITKDIGKRLVALTLTDRIDGESDQLQLQLANHDQRLALPSIGKKLTVALGYQHQQVTMGEYIVDQRIIASPPHTLTIVAKSANFLGELTVPKIRSWHENSLGGIIETIAGENQLKPRVSRSLSDLPITHDEQTLESDLHFLTRLAQTYGAWMKPVNAYLLFLEHGQSTSVTGKILKPVWLLPKDIMHWQLTLTERENYDQVFAYWRSSNQVSLQTVKFPVVTKNNETQLKTFTLRKIFASSFKAEHAAKARFNDFIRHRSVLHLSVLGNPYLFAGSQIQMKRLSSALDGVWQVIKVTHQLDKNGFITQLEAYRKE